MRLATVHDGTRDGALVVVDATGTRAASAANIAPSLQAALDDWERAEPRLQRLAADLDAGRVPAMPLDAAALRAPLPRAYEWIDGSAYLSHVRLVRRARGADPPPTLETDPLVYQGGSGHLLGPTEDVVLADPAWGLDFEGEVAVVLGDTPQGTRASEALGYVRLLVLVNDWTLRDLVPAELAKGFGFFCSKPASALSPFAVTPDELGAAWRDGRVHLPLSVALNGTRVGDPDAGAMHFSFADLIAHISKTRRFVAGTILGSGTVSNDDPARGVSCLAERRAREIIEHGRALTPYLVPGDEVALEMIDENGRNVFGTLRQRVVTP
ncbi:MAG: fumarylacetoacetate hydrolase family protein [Pseudomonadota bacterium]